MMASKVLSLGVLACGMYEWSEMKSRTNDLLQIINILVGWMRAGQGRPRYERTEGGSIPADWHSEGTICTLEVWGRAGVACRATSESAMKPVKTVGESKRRLERCCATIKKKNRGKRVRLTVKEVFDFALYESTDQPRPPTFKRYD